MPQPRFIHLRLHSEHSVTDGTTRIEQAVAAARADHQPALALTDLGNLFGLVKFYKSARAAGVKPICGADLWLAGEGDGDGSRLLLLVRDHAGYLALCRLMTRAYREGMQRGRPFLRREWFDAEALGGLIMLCGARNGEIGRALLGGQPDTAAALAREWSARFPGAFYLEAQRDGSPVSETHTRAAARLASALDLPLVATHPVQFLTADDFRAHEARVCIAEGQTLSDRRRPRVYTPQQYFASQAEMLERFADLPQALENTVEIARRCNLVLALGKSRLPLFPTPPGVTLDEHLVAESQAGLERRLLQRFADPAERETQRPRYRERLAFECQTIIQMGFPGYFLIVADFISWAKNNGVPVGPGRGSGAGSLVAYSLGITDLDPLRYDLLFERFLNPERVSMPDFDIDFCQEGRDRVIDYVRQKYGEESVSQIATFGTMAARAVLRDVGRVLEWGYNRTDELVKLVPNLPGKTVTLRRRTDPDDKQTLYAREESPEIEAREAQDEETAQLLALAEQLEGTIRNVGMHAGGVLIAPGKLTDFCPLYMAEGGDPVSQFDKDDVEAAGLVKFDFLGLTTLTILAAAEKAVRALPVEAGGDPGFDLNAIPLDDRATFDLLAGANTTAVFQLESRGMKDMLKRAKPDRFEDIIALVALYRPGPMDLIPDFIERKHGKQRVEYLDERLKPILGETYGIMVYQEQVMQIAQVIGGYSLGGADLLRRAMGKKKPEEMAAHRVTFTQGAAKNGVPEARATELFDLMERFAGYGFNKSHAAAYALVAYQTAYMKAHHAAAFAAANMSSAMDDTDKLRVFFEDARQNSIDILPPDINASDYRFVPVNRHQVRYGLGGIKGVGEGAILSLVAARREAGPFTSLFDFCLRVDRRLANRRTIEALIRGGALDTLHGERAAMIASVGLAMEAAQQAEANANQASLFGDDPVAAPSQTLVECAPWCDEERLTAEKAVLGFYLSGHPFDAAWPRLQGFVKTRLKDLQPARETQVLAGIVVDLRVVTGPRGRRGLVRLDDNTAVVEVTVFGETLDINQANLGEERLVVIEGRASHDDFSDSTRVVADAVFDLDAARTRFARRVTLRMNGDSDMARLRGLLQPHASGATAIRIDYRNGDATAQIDLGQDWRVRLTPGLLGALTEWLSVDNIGIEYGLPEGGEARARRGTGAYDRRGTAG
ncbi:MAG: DNA polymerase III subunit alpha [Betaproteobacteria bacterium]|nr:DNA polymerase III subunit alpha [Betaproteobacteria bacterium]